VMGTLVKKGQKKWQILLQPLSKMSKNKKAYILEPKEVDSYSINFPTLRQIFDIFIFRCNNLMKSNKKIKLHKDFNRFDKLCSNYTNPPL